MPALTLVQLQDLFFDITVTMTGYDEKKVRHAYQPQGQPGNEISQDIVYLDVMEVDNQWNRQRNDVQKNSATYESGFITLEDGSFLVTENGEKIVADPYIAATSDIETSYTRVIQTRWTVYGTTCYDMASVIAWKILNPDIREALREHDVKPVCDIPAPILGREMVNGQWWQRTDLTVLFYAGTVRTNDVPTLIATDIHVVPEALPERIIEITR